jgi:putative membrane protein
MIHEKPRSNIPGGASWKEYPGLLWRGMAMGTAEVIPGVSGGTIALITGILNRFVEAIHSADYTAVKYLFKMRIKELLSHVHWRFLVMLFSGQILGILLFTRCIPLPSLLRTYPEPMLGLFFGLILGSIVILAVDTGLPRLKGSISYLAGGVIGCMVVAGVQAETPETAWFLFVCGAVAICAWILPGVSGSFVLLLIHKYDYVWEAITLSNNMPVLWNLLNVIIPFGFGAVAGLVSFSRVLSLMMNRFPRYTTMAMNGILIASLWSIFPFQHAVFQIMASGKEKLVRTTPYIPTLQELLHPSGILALGLGAAGFVLVLWIGSLARKKKETGGVSGAADK